jgi:TRAP-type C4-dicarboxylate transport system permease small subunit
MMSLGKFLMWMSIAFLIMFGLTMVFMIISMFTNLMNGAIDSWISMIMCISCLLFFLYIVYDISLISKSQVYVSMKDDAIQMNYALMFGFILLVDFVGLVWTIAYMFLRYAR